MSSGGFYISGLIVRLIKEQKEFETCHCVVWWAYYIDYYLLHSPPPVSLTRMGRQIWGLYHYATLVVSRRLGLNYKI